MKSKHFDIKQKLLKSKNEITNFDNFARGISFNLTN